MKYERTSRARNDYGRLSAGDKQRFRAAVAVMNQAYDERGDKVIPVWPKQLRVKSVEETRSVWEMTWSWPDGRATFEYVEVEAGEVAIRWRRIGGHEILPVP